MKGNYGAVFSIFLCHHKHPPIAQMVEVDYSCSTGTYF